jgi:hypothetical protein
VATLTVWKFDEVGGAGDTLATIQDLQHRSSSRFVTPPSSPGPPTRRSRGRSSSTISPAPVRWVVPSGDGSSASCSGCP